MQENHRNAQDDSYIVETCEPFTITRAALNRHIISSTECNRLKQEPANQLGDISQPVLLVQKVVRNFLKSFRWARKSLFQTEENVARKKLLVVLWCSYRQYYRRKANTVPSNFTERCSLQKLIYNVWNWNLSALFFLEFKKTPPFTLSTADIVFFLFQVGWFANA